jgi:hypothetical protein
VFLEEIVRLVAVDLVEHLGDAIVGVRHCSQAAFQASSITRLTDRSGEGLIR